MRIREQLYQILSTTIQHHFNLLTLPEFLIKNSSREGYGDFTTTIAFSLSKILKRSPIEIAREIAQGLEANPFIHRVETIEPGYVNLYMSQDWKTGIIQGLQGSKRNLTSQIQVQCTPEIIEEIGYILYRVPWVIDVFVQEGFIIEPIVDLEILHLTEERELIDLMIELLILVEEGEQKKIKDTLTLLVNSFTKYRESLLLRGLKADRLNGVLNLFLGVSGLLTCFRMPSHINRSIENPDKV